ncbi:MAG: Rieske 2Fe-2S domain-containing protein [Anaerolineae bacterium]|nr:Rieske 2Fe-2S domain-containing protein [Anaerolineae bacterium]
MTEASEPSIPVAKRGAEDAGQYFRYMAEFIGFGDADAEAIRQTRSVIEKHLPDIVTKFYAHLLRYPPTRRFFLKKDGSLNHDYLELRMRHLTNFWLRTAEAVYNDDYASYVDYVGRAHTARGADPNIYIAERYVIGQVGMMSHAISEALSRELRDGDPELEFRAVEAWDKLLMVILELLARAYGHEREAATFDPLVPVDQQMVADLAARVVEGERGRDEPMPVKDVIVAKAAAIPDGDRSIVQVDGLSIGVFHHNGSWYALRNSCMHRGGPVGTGPLEGDILVCPWHGFQYNITTGECLADPSARLDMYPVTVQDGQIHLQIPDLDAHPGKAGEETLAAPAAPGALQPNEFRVADIPAGQIRTVQVDGEEAAVYNIDGAFYATGNACTHTGGPLSEGDLMGKIVTCTLHGSQFDVTTCAVLEGPAEEPLRCYRVTIDGEVGRVETNA